MMLTRASRRSPPARKKLPPLGALCRPDKGEDLGPAAPLAARAGLARSGPGLRVGLARAARRRTVYFGVGLTPNRTEFRVRATGVSNLIEVRIPTERAWTRTRIADSDRSTRTCYGCSGARGPSDCRREEMRQRRLRLAARAASDAVTSHGEKMRVLRVATGLA